MVALPVRADLIREYSSVHHSVGKPPVVLVWSYGSRSTSRAGGASGVRHSTVRRDAWTQIIKTMGIVEWISYSSTCRFICHLIPKGSMKVQK